MKEIITPENISRFIKVMDGEEWKTVVDYPQYLISSYGRCFSLYRRRLLTPILCADKDVLQYFCYKLTENKKSRWIRVHRIVAKAFLDNPEGKREVHHKNFDAHNNNVDNLCWVNHYEHMQLHYKRDKNAA